MEFRRKMIYVKYEALVENVDSFIQQINQVTGLTFPDFDPDNMEQGTFNPDVAPNQKKTPWQTSLQHGKKIASSSVGNYKQILSPHEIDEINRLCEPILSTFKYQF